jgi:DNA-binding transcriptional LysR family regulator
MDGLLRNLRIGETAEKPIYCDDIYQGDRYMLDALSLDQLRTFIAAAEEGSFSAAGRKLRRAQSLISQTVANLEGQLNVQLFDRAKKKPRLTDAGSALLQEAKAVVQGANGFKARARTIAEGLEPELSAVIDVVYPMAALTSAVGFFRKTYPNTPLRLYVEALGGVIQPVLDGRCRIGVIGTFPTIPDTLNSEPLLEVPFVTVVAPSHALAQVRGIVPMGKVAQHVQLVLTDRTSVTEGKNFGVLSPLTWKLADMGAKLAFLRAGFGWGHMPLPMVQNDLENRSLVKIRIEGFPVRGQFLLMQAVYRKDAPPGPAGRAFIRQLKAKTSIT